MRKRDGTQHNSAESHLPATVVECHELIRQLVPVQVLFDLSSGGSVGVAGGFDTITNFGMGDVIKLPAAVKKWNMLTVTADEWVPGDAAAKQATLLSAWQAQDGQAFDVGAGGMIKVILGGNAYLLADSNGNGLFDSGANSPSPDLFVKLVGVASVALLMPETLTT